MRPSTSVWREARVVVAVILLGSAAYGIHAQEPFVPVSAEPKHRMKLDTAKYRVYDVFVDSGEATLFHEHKADLFAVFLSQSDLTNDVQGGQKTEASVRPGIVTFAAASPTKSYVHRVLLRGESPFRNITIELLQAQAPAATTDSPEQLDPALATLRESPRGKAFRLNLEPNQTAKLPSRASDIFVVCLSDGSVIQQGAGQSSASWDCKVGDFRLLEQPREGVLKNPTSARVDLVVIALQ